MLPAAAAVLIVVFCLIPKEGPVFSGEIVVKSVATGRTIIMWLL